MIKVLHVAVFGNESISRSLRPLIRRENSNLEVVLTIEEEIFDHGRNSANPEIYTMSPARQKIIRQALNQDLDSVVIAHNLGHGICRAQIVPEHLLDRTIVVLERRSPEVIRMYRECGISHFSTREKIGKKILHLSKSLQKATAA